METQQKHQQKHQQNPPLQSQQQQVLGFDTGGSVASPGAYRRASRKGALRKFSCDHPDCDKVYSRAEHLQRHQLNHSPKEIFRCDESGCAQKFVRADLLARHKKRHSSSYIPRNRAPSFSHGQNGTRASSTPGTNAILSPPIGAGLGVETRSFTSHPSLTMTHDAATLLSPIASRISQPTPLNNLANAQLPPRIAPQSTGWPTSVANLNAMRPKPTFFHSGGPPTVEPSGVMSYSTTVPFQEEEAMSRENFAVWLFDPQNIYAEFSVSSLPFLEGGLESHFNTNIHYEYESLASSTSQLDASPVDGDDLLGEFRRQEILRWFRVFRSKQPKSEPLIENLVHESGGDLPALHIEMMRDCLHEYWEHVSPRVPIIHQPTFACNRCPILLLMVMVSLGAASLRGRDTSGNLRDYGAFADVIMTSIRWEIVIVDEASPPIALWAAQALILLEFYEKMYSTRFLHERAHIHHSTTLMLLRRGSPLIGRAGTESPSEEADAGGVEPTHGVSLDARSWWIRWAETEAMHRVVFVAFMLDVVHASMFGHDSLLAPHEIRLPLPCDDGLWTGSSPEAVRSMDATLRMYGFKHIAFLDGLKRALHGNEVKTHPFGRMIIMSGLLSVGWHLRHRETHLKWLDLTPAKEAHETWRGTLLRAFDDWKASFDNAHGQIVSATHRAGTANGPIHSAALLYHLAHISLHADIVDCQVYAGVKAILGRKVSTRDFTNVTTRMKGWAGLPSTRHAVLHAFKLLYRVLVDSSQRRNDKRRPPPPLVADAQGLPINLPPIETQTYSCRSEPDPHRPWIMYYAALVIWSFVRAISGRPETSSPASFDPVGNHRRVIAYLTTVTSLPELSVQATVSILSGGLPDLLDGLQHILVEADWELLREAHIRLKICRDILTDT